jgi:hypothetical protein
MIADQWIKTLNARLSGCPSVRGKIGYGLLILVVGSVTAVVFVAVKLLQGVLFLVSGTIKNLWNGNYDNTAEKENVSGYQYGPEGYGFYRNGRFQYPSAYEDDD